MHPVLTLSSSEVDRVKSYINTNNTLLDTKCKCTHPHYTHACTHTRMYTPTHPPTQTHTHNLFGQEASIRVYPLGNKGTHKVLGRLHIHTNPTNTNKVINFKYLIVDILQVLHMMSWMVIL